MVTNVVCSTGPFHNPSKKTEIRYELRQDSRGYYLADYVKNIDAPHAHSRENMVEFTDFLEAHTQYLARVFTAIGNFGPPILI